MIPLLLSTTNLNQKFDLKMHYGEVILRYVESVLKSNEKPYQRLSLRSGKFYEGVMKKKLKDNDAKAGIIILPILRFDVRTIMFTERHFFMNKICKRTEERDF